MGWNPQAEGSWIPCKDWFPPATFSQQEYFRLKNTFFQASRDGCQPPILLTPVPSRYHNKVVLGGDSQAMHILKSTPCSAGALVLTDNRKLAMGFSVCTCNMGIRTAPGWQTLVASTAWDSIHVHDPTHPKKTTPLTEETEGAQPGTRRGSGPTKP